MRFCRKCGAEIRDGSGICPRCNNVSCGEARVGSYDQYVVNAATTNAIALVSLIAGVLVGLMVNNFLGAGLCLVAEFVAVMPNTNVQKALKNDNRTLAKPELKSKAKRCVNELKEKYSGFKFSFVLSYIALACLILVFIV